MNFFLRAIDICAFDSLLAVQRVRPQKIYYLTSQSRYSLNVAMSFDVAATRQASSVSTPVREGAKALISTDERVLLVKERHTDGEPFWTLPGGGLEPGETYAEAIERELAEELRCRVSVDAPVTNVVYGHCTSDTVSTYRVIECTLISTPKPNVAEGILDARWVSPDAMPPRTLPQIRCLWW